MGQPVSITGSRGGPDTPPVNIGKVLGKARIPLAPAFGVRSGEVRDVFDRGAKTGGADHGAVAAGKATRGHLFPAGVIGILVEEVLDTCRVEMASHLRRGLRYDVFGDLNILCRCVMMRHVMHDIRALYGADLHQKNVAVAVQNLRQGEIESAGHLGSCLHRDAKARATGLTAIYRDRKHVLTAGGVGRVGIGAVHEDLVLDRDGVELTRADPKKGIPGDVRTLIEKLKPVILTLRLP